MHAEIETEDDVVPLLRKDLVITQSPASRGTRDVTDPVASKTFALYDFEVTIARMLDGKRNAGEVINAANRLGIPVTLPTLRTFLTQLRAYQFIDTSKPAEADTTWSPRRKWTAEARELYQSALRLLRAGKFDDARGYVDALVAADPENEEIAGLRARIEAAAAGGDLSSFDESAAAASDAPMSIDDDAQPLPVPSLGVNPPEPELPFTSSSSSISIEETAPLANLMSSSVAHVDATEPLVATTPAPRTTSLPLIPLEVSQAVAAPLPTDLLPPMDPHATIPATPSVPEPVPEVTDPIAAPLPNDTAQTMEPLPPVTTELPVRPAKKKSKLPLIIAAVAVLAIAGVLLRPVESRTSMRCELKPVVLGTAMSPRAGTVKQSDVQSGEFVAKGAIIARLEAVPLDDGQVTTAAKKLELEKQLAALRPPPAAKVKKAKLAVKKAEAAVKSAEKAATKARGKKQAAALKTLESKEAALQRARTALDLLSLEKKQAELTAAIEELANQNTGGDAASSVIEAPVDGVVLLPELPATLEANGVFAQLVEAKLSIATNAVLPEGATKATLKLGNIERPVPITNGKATVTLDPALVGAKGELIFPGRKQPWVMTLLNP